MPDTRRCPCPDVSERNAARLRCGHDFLRTVPDFRCPRDWYDLVQVGASRVSVCRFPLDGSLWASRRTAAWSDGRAGGWLLQWSHEAGPGRCGRPLLVLSGGAAQHSAFAGHRCSTQACRPRYLSNWTFSGQVSVELDIYTWTLQTQRLLAAIGAKREYWPWNVTVTVSVGPLRCLARIRSASPFRGDSGSYSSSR